MPRQPRGDAPGNWFHVMNRGLARRTVFETRRDARTFLALLARSVRRGELELHAFSILTTHFHLLVRSRGALSKSLRRAQNEYVRWFNRGRRRDGPLFRGRFLSKPVRSLAYRLLLVRYIDANPVMAGLAAEAWDHPHGSACRYRGPKGPPWLTRGWVESQVAAQSGRRAYDPALYPLVFGASRTPGEVRLVEHRLHAPSTARDDPTDDLDDLLRAGPERFLARMRRKTRLADGTRLGLAVCDPVSVEALLDAERSAGAGWSLSVSRKSVDGWSLARVALLRELCALSMPAIAGRTGLSTSGVAQMLARHRRLLDGPGPDPAGGSDYGPRLAALARGALDASGLSSVPAFVRSPIVEEVS